MLVTIVYMNCPTAVVDVHQVAVLTYHHLQVIILHLLGEWGYQIAVYLLFRMINVYVIREGPAAAGFDGLFKAQQKHRPLGAAVGHEVGGILPVTVPEADKGLRADAREFE